MKKGLLVMSLCLGTAINLALVKDSIAVEARDSGSVQYSTKFASDKKTFTAYTYTSSGSCTLQTTAKYWNNGALKTKTYNKARDPQTGYAMVSREPLPSGATKWESASSKHYVNGVLINTTSDRP